MELVELGRVAKGLPSVARTISANKVVSTNQIKPTTDAEKYLHNKINAHVQGKSAANRLAGGDGTHVRFGWDKAKNAEPWKMARSSESLYDSIVRRVSSKWTASRAQTRGRLDASSGKYYKKQNIKLLDKIQS